MDKYQKALKEIKEILDKSNDSVNFDGDVIWEYNMIAKIVREALKDN